MSLSANHEIAGRLEEVAQMLEVGWQPFIDGACQCLTVGVRGSITVLEHVEPGRFIGR